MTHLSDIQMDELKDSLLDEKKGLEGHFAADKEEEDDSLLAS
jgi:hypothetical protein